MSLIKDNTCPVCNIVYGGYCALMRHLAAAELSDTAHCEWLLNHAGVRADVSRLTRRGRPSTRVSNDFAVPTAPAPVAKPVIRLDAASPSSSTILYDEPSKAIVFDDRATKSVWRPLPNMSTLAESVILSDPALSHLAIAEKLAPSYPHVDPKSLVDIVHGIQVGAKRMAELYCYWGSLKQADATDAAADTLQTLMTRTAIGHGSLLSSHLHPPSCHRDDYLPSRLQFLRSRSTEPTSAQPSSQPILPMEGHESSNAPKSMMGELSTKFSLALARFGGASVQDQAVAESEPPSGGPAAAHPSVQVPQAETNVADVGVPPLPGIAIQIPNPIHGDASTTAVKEPVDGGFVYEQISPASSPTRSLSGIDKDPMAAVVVSSTQPPTAGTHLPPTVAEILSSLPVPLPARSGHATTIRSRGTACDSREVSVTLRRIDQPTSGKRRADDSDDESEVERRPWLQSSAPQPKPPARLLKMDGEGRFYDATGARVPIAPPVPARSNRNKHR